VLGLRFEALRRTGPLTQLSEQAAA
jgi:hypothetical protein